MSDPVELLRAKAAAWVRHSTRADRWRSTAQSSSDKVMLFGKEMSLFDPGLNRWLYMNGCDRHFVVPLRLHPLRTNVAGIRLLILAAEFVAPLTDFLVVAARFALKPPELAEHTLITVGDTIYADAGSEDTTAGAARREFFRRIRHCVTIRRLLASELHTLAQLQLVDALVDPPRSLRALYVAAWLREAGLAAGDLGSWLAQICDDPDPALRYRKGLSLAFPAGLRSEHLRRAAPDRGALRHTLNTLKEDLGRLTLPMAGDKVDGRQLGAACLRSELAGSVQEYHDGTELVGAELVQAIRDANAKQVRRIQAKIQAAAVGA